MQHRQPHSPLLLFPLTKTHRCQDTELGSSEVCQEGGWRRRHKDCGPSQLCTSSWSRQGQHTGKAQTHRYRSTSHQFLPLFHTPSGRYKILPSANQTEVHKFHDDAREVAQGIVCLLHYPMTRVQIPSTHVKGGKG